MYGKPEPGKKLFPDISDEEQQKLVKGVGQGLFFAGFFALLLMLAILCGVLSRQDQSSNEKTPSQLTPTLTTHNSLTSSPPIKILDYQLKKDQWFAYVEGNIKNTSSRVVSYAEVWAYFYDAAGRRIGEYLDNTVDLGPGMIWRFRISYLGDKREVARVEVAVGSWWFK